jgi:hypothetical protein
MGLGTAFAKNRNVTDATGPTVSDFAGANKEPISWPETLATVDAFYLSASIGKGRRIRRSPDAAILVFGSPALAEGTQG